MRFDGKAWLALMRPANVFTAVADSMAGLVIVRAGWPALGDPGWWLLPASACLYLGGMVLNDFFDREEDARDRPERPIPSGRVPAAGAGALGFGFLAAGIAFAAPAGLGAMTIAACLALVILFYDALLKGTPMAAWNMGLCRALNFILPFGLVDVSVAAWMFVPAASLGLYITVVTYLSRDEVGGNAPARARTAVYSMGAVFVTSALVIAAWKPSLVAYIIFAALGVRLLDLYRPLLANASGPKTGRAIGGSILSIPLLDAAWVAAAGFDGPGLAIAVWMIPALILGRTFSPT